MFGMSSTRLCKTMETWEPITFSPRFQTSFVNLWSGLTLPTQTPSCISMNTVSCPPPAGPRRNQMLCSTLSRISRTEDVPFMVLDSNRTSTTTILTISSKMMVLASVKTSKDTKISESRLKWLRLMFTVPPAAGTRTPGRLKVRFSVSSFESA